MNKPTAWMLVHRETQAASLTFETPTREQKISRDAVPLYAIKELRDEQILKLAADMFHYTEYKQAIQFARKLIKEITYER